MKKSYDLREISRAAGARQDEGIRQIKKGPHVVVLALGRVAQKKKLTVTFRRHSSPSPSVEGLDESPRPPEKCWLRAGFAASSL